MIYLNKKDKKKRIIFRRNETNYLILKTLNNSLKTNFLSKKLMFLTKSSVSSVSTKNRCVISSKSSSIYRNFKLSRNFLKEKIKNNVIYKYKKGSF